MNWVYEPISDWSWFTNNKGETIDETTFDDRYLIPFNQLTGILRPVEAVAEGDEIIMLCRIDESRKEVYPEYAANDTSLIKSSRIFSCYKYQSDAIYDIWFKSIKYNGENYKFGSYSHISDLTTWQPPEYIQIIINCLFNAHTSDRTNADNYAKKISINNIYLDRTAFSDDFFTACTTSNGFNYIPEWMMTGCTAKNIYLDNFDTIYANFLNGILGFQDEDFNSIVNIYLNTYKTDIKIEENALNFHFCDPTLYFNTEELAQTYQSYVDNNINGWGVSGILNTAKDNGGKAVIAVNPNAPVNPDDPSTNSDDLWSKFMWLWIALIVVAVIAIIGTSVAITKRKKKHKIKNLDKDLEKIMK